MRMSCALLACLVASAAAAEDVRLPVREVTVFKDGHALVLREGRAPVNGLGDVQLYELPAPVLGTFWPYSAEDGAMLRAVTAGVTTVDGERPVRGLWELLQHNIGATVAFRDAKGERVEGVIESLIAESAGGAGGAMVAVRVDGALRLMPVGYLHDLTFLGGDVDQTAPEQTSRNMLTMDLDWGAGPGGADDAEVGLMYLQRGLRWIPSYRITIDGKGGAKVELQATLVNELIDLEDVTMNLVIGAPSFAFAGTPDPIGLQQLAQLGQYFDARAQTGAALGQALMTQARFGERRDYQAEAGGSAPTSPEVVGGGRTEDLFVFTLTGVSLKQGERMVIPVAQYEATYEDVYRLDLPVAPPPFAWQHFNSQQQREIAKLLHKPRARHIIRLTNGDEYPITTAPALVMAADEADGADGRAARVLAQGLIPYTPARAVADLAINEAFDIEFEEAEREVERRMNDTIFNGSHFHYAQLAGSMELTNHRDQPVRVEVTRYVLGALDDVPEAVEATSVSIFTDEAFAAPGEQTVWWTWYHWPWWWMRMNGAQKLEWHTTLEPGASESVEWTWHYWWQ